MNHMVEVICRSAFLAPFFKFSPVDGGRGGGRDRGRDGEGEKQMEAGA